MVISVLKANNLTKNYIIMLSFIHKGLIRGVMSLTLASAPFLLIAQGTLEDYRRAEAIKNNTLHSVYHEPTGIEWKENGSIFWYKQQTVQGEQYVVVDQKNHKKNVLFDTEKLHNALSKHSNENIDKRALPISKLEVLQVNGPVRFEAFGKHWQYDPSSNMLSDQGEVKTNPNNRGYFGRSFDERTGDPVQSPDGKWKAYIKNSNVYTSKADGSEERQLSYDGSPGEYYSVLIRWSPDSEHLAVNRIRPGGQRTLYLIESSPIDQLQPKLHTRNYLKPGDALQQKQPHLFHVTEGLKSKVPATMIANQYNLTHPVWYPDGHAFTIEYNQRGHQQYSVIRVEAKSGAVKEVIQETSKTFIHYSAKNYRYDVANGQEIIWASERDGWNHLYLYDGLTGAVKNQITTGEWVVRHVVHVDDKNRKILFAGSGMDSDQDPYFIHYFTVDFDGKNLRKLTQENGNHVAVFSPDYSYFVDQWSRLDEPSTTVLRSALDGKILMELEKADISDLLATGWQMPEVFNTKGRDGETDIWGMIIRPSNFDPNKKYPIIEYIYAGPHDSFVPKSFVIDSRGDLHQLAELGFIVVQIDGMGTSNRSKAFHDVIYQNLKDSGFPDRMIWIKEAAKKYPYMDLERVGIFGNSAGGQSSAGALLHHPDFYKVAVSSSGCHDNRMDKIWWNEQFMGFPIGEHYEESSNVTHAHKLEGKLLLILGELDDNVDPSSTFQLINAIIKADKYVDFLFIPGMGHSLGGNYGEHRRRDFFIKHLIGVDPPEWSLF